MKKLVKPLCIVLCVLLCASILFSAGSAAYGHSHDCIGEDCRYCQAVLLHKELIRIVLLGCFGASVLLVCVYLVMNLKSHGYGKKQNISLVADKVKLTA